MRIFRTLLAGAALALAAVLLIVMPAFGVANTPTYRSCAFTGGLDPDFVQISGASSGPSGLTVAPGTASVTVEASESSDPLDNLGHDTFTLTTSAPGAPPQTVSGQGTGHVTLSVPLAATTAGSVNTITWQAVFDDGAHPCPGPGDPLNPKSGANPFVVTVAQGSGPVVSAVTLTGLRQSHSTWREPGSAAPKRHSVPVGTAFSFALNHAASVTLRFSPGTGLGSSGSLTVTGKSGQNSVPFNGKIGTRRPLAAGRYLVTVIAKDSAGTQSVPLSLKFTIVS